ncbi:MAG: Tim44 domain-containing protein [Candidatus Rokuibacteriota bacterium]|nr:MAG: Tim44 domain-containing protein [Candidatus Rokubacteria bacterium]
MKRMTAMIALLVMVLVPVLWTAEAWARAGGGSSGGSRGSRGLSTPSSPAPMSPTRPSTAPAPSPQQSPSRWGGMGGMLGGLLVGGLIGSLLFGGGHGFGGIGLMEILIVGGLIWLAVSFLRRRQQQPAAPSGYAAPDDARNWAPTPAQYTGTGPTTMEAPADLERGITNIRQMDPDFDLKRVADAGSDIFFKVQAAWMARDMSAAAGVLTPEMQNILQRDCDTLRRERKLNRLENIAVRSTDVTEAWQEAGHDYVTVRFLANLLDYTTDESGSQVLEGSRTEPVKFEEYWTFVRPVGPNAFRLSAIQQA